ncbi:MAG TPA: hypothetical protein VGM93_11880 [Acidimicrobiales bacterium]|jgi:hypothetical protein
MSGQHFLVVEAFDPDDDTDRFEIEHPADCPTESIYEGRLLVHRCHVALHEDNGITEHFRHADDPDPFDTGSEPVGVGRHPIEAWTEKISGWESTEYRGGLRLTDAGVR